MLIITFFFDSVQAGLTSSKKSPLVGKAELGTLCTSIVFGASPFTVPFILDLNFLFPSLLAGAMVELLDPKYT